MSRQPEFPQRDLFGEWGLDPTVVSPAAKSMQAFIFGPVKGRRARGLPEAGRRGITRRLRGLLAYLAENGRRWAS